MPVPKGDAPVGRPVTTAAETKRGDAMPQGRLSKALRGLFMKRATIAAVDEVAPGFRLITLEGPALQGVAWTPGQKLQVAFGATFATRTFTPIDWDAGKGRTRILGFMHGEAPASGWLNDLEVGDEYDVFGPRGSLDVRSLARPLAVFGDETSIGLAYALQEDREHATTSRFEVGDEVSAERVIETLDLAKVTVFKRKDDDTHLEQMEASLLPLIGDGGSFVLTGKAGTIQRLQQALKRLGIAPDRIATKAYWAPGKAGLD